MSDSTYSPKVYRTQGGNSIVVASGGTVQCDSGSLVGFGGATPVVQPSGAGQAAVGTIAPDLSAWNGSTDPTAAQATAINAAIDALKTLVNQLRSDLVTVGIIKGSA